MGKLYIGIDPGLSGGVAVIDNDGNMINMMTMPNTLHGRRNTVEIRELESFIKTYVNATVIIESAQKFSAGTNALTSTWFGFGRITAMLELNGIRHEIIASPLTWQKAFWTKPKMPKEVKFDTKAASVAAAKRLFPGLSFLRSERCSKPHDGLTDAALIAEYGRRLNL